jgi:hypothetical protein
VRLADHTMWQSSNEGYTWNQIVSSERFLAFYLHSYSNDRAYLITSTTKFYYTTDTGRSWYALDAPSVPNSFGAQVLQFHPQSDNLLWVGNMDCTGTGENCHAVAHFSRDNGRNWNVVEKYVRNCAWARDADLKVDSTQILCESYKDKKGNQRFFQNNPLELVSGTNYFRKKTKLFDQVVGFTKFSEYLVVAEVRFLPVIGIYLVTQLDSIVSAGTTNSGSPGIVGRTNVCRGQVPTQHAPRNTCKYLSPSVFNVS